MSQNRNSIEKEIRELIKTHLELNMQADEINDELLFGAAGGFDSTSLLEFILALEDHYNILIPDEDLVPEIFGSITKITNYIDNMQR